MCILFGKQYKELKTMCHAPDVQDSSTTLRMQRKLCGGFGTWWIVAIPLTRRFILDVEVADLVREKCERIGTCLIAVEAILRWCILGLVVCPSEGSLSGGMTERRMRYVVGRVSRVHATHRWKAARWMTHLAELAGWTTSESSPRPECIGTWSIW